MWSSVTLKVNLSSIKNTVRESNRSFRNKTIEISKKVVRSPKEGEHLGYVGLDRRITLKRMLKNRIRKLVVNQLAQKEYQH
jgi:hypothetical protein